MDQNKAHLEYKEMLRADYARNYIEIIFDKTNKTFDYIYLYNSRYGTIHFENGKKEIHKWETEDEAQTGSFLNKNYQIICLDGITFDKDIEIKIIEENSRYAKTLKLNDDEANIINSAIECLKNTK